MPYFVWEENGRSGLFSFAFLTFRSDGFGTRAAGRRARAVNYCTPARQRLETGPAYFLR
jgi:hypothetical protein